MIRQLADMTHCLPPDAAAGKIVTLNGPYRLAIYGFARPGREEANRPDDPLK